MNIKWICIGGPYGDEMSVYKGTFKKSLTVQDFIENEIKPGEWGDIEINGNMLCSYDRKKFREIRKDLMEHYCNSIITTITSVGGWSCMDYSLTVKEPEVLNNNLAPLYLDFNDGFNF